MSNGEHFLGDDIPGFDVNDICPPPEELSAEVQELLDELNTLRPLEYKRKLVNWLANKKKRLVDLEADMIAAQSDIASLQNKVDIAQGILQSINATLADHESRIFMLEGA